MSLPERIASHPVVLRAFALADAPRITELCGDWEVARMTGLIPHPYLPEMAESFIAGCHRAVAADGPRTFAITRAGDGLLVGAIGLATSADAIDSFGYWVGRPYWGNGYATAAARAVIALAFSRLDIDALQAIHLARNPASGRVMAKCGMSELRREMRPHRGGPTEEFLVWSIGRNAWERATLTSH
ncbi:MAG: GNAT family N-acetyltransferase [Casimicrobiaceae bacterium]